MSGYEEGSLESDGGIYHRDGYASVSVAGAIPYVVKHVYSPTRACLFYAIREQHGIVMYIQGTVVIIPHTVHCIIFSYPSRILFTRNAGVAVWHTNLNTCARWRRELLRRISTTHDLAATTRVSITDHPRPPSIDRNMHERIAYQTCSHRY
ncbi:hypothetical protein F5J12DRAFT_510904 [Pisolithus orientalis]|uniref:uncharacterized protein n=1 Tax=Pisolithus orientalis TaxID=936130 RepID=UPI0022241C86|nr:uncharacterized protein F5J12DRAFT_510904 [Pisolithus orientalis]KAI5988643.1 hypothetical protein F5J12DRAFT_510904 [Pisolithus orientalis]